MAAPFIPRAVFPTQLSLPRSYYLGHHAAGLSKMKTMLSSIDLIIECRDYRVPLTSRNPLFEQSLAGRERIVVYTKRDLGSQASEEDKKREATIRAWHHPSPMLFASQNSPRTIHKLLSQLRAHAARISSLTGTRLLVVGMPNVGKSTLLNSLRRIGVGRGKAASTGASPGVTRKIASGVKILDADAERGTEAVYLVDTPGVFVPYVPDAGSMLKLALVGCVKDSVVAPTVLADYLLYAMNQHDASGAAYARFCGPTNDISVLLEAAARATGRLQRGGLPDVEATALWLVQRFRAGDMGRFVLDDVSEEGLRRKREDDAAVSLNQARKMSKEAQRERTRQRHADAGNS